MRYRRVGRSQLEVSALALGTWLTFGETVDKDAAHAIVGAAVDAGITTIDTANSYAFGEAERIIGEVLQDFRNERLVVLTKCYFSTDPHRPEPEGLSKSAIVRAADASLRRLRRDCLDLLQCHRFDGDTPVREVVETMEELCDDGKIRYWGVSKWSEREIVAAIGCGARRLVSHQDVYNLFNRGPERRHFAFCQNEGLGFLAYSPLARGVLSGKYLDGIPAGTRAAHATQRNTIYDLSAEKVSKVRALKTLAERKGVSCAQLALAFYLQHDAVSSVIIGASRPQQIIENAAALDINLTQPEYAEVDQLFSGYQ